MDRVTLENLLNKFHGCTFATIDSETSPSPGIRKIETGKRVILFKSPHYADMVKRRLIEAGKDPNNFVIGEMPWGQRVPNSPLIEHRGKTYLQVVELVEGQSKYFLLGMEQRPEDLGIRPRRTNQGLPEGDEVIVRCYSLDSITRIVLMGQTVLAANEKSIVPL
jgi:hypothetical protein